MIDDPEYPARRIFLRRMAAVTGAAPFAPALLAATAVATTTRDVNAAEQPDPHPADRSVEGEAAHQTVRLAEYAAALRYEDLPPAVVQRAKDVIADAVATITYGAELPWSRILVGYARRTGAGGKSRILGVPDAAVQAPSAALANGALAHAFELDSLTEPNSGSHPGATLLSSALAVAQERGIGGRELIAAVVAGAEVMIRIGRATKHSNEARGFHAPGTTGPFGAAVAVGRLIGLDAARMTNALGIAGSLAGGLLEFARSGDGAMVKRLHLGRAAESGVLAASLAADGFTGPSTVLEGEFGFLKVFCREWDMAELTNGLGQRYATLTVMMKRFACHITAHTPVEAILDLQATEKFSAPDVAAIAVTGSERMARINNIPAPRDLMMAQYSIPFCVALAVHRDPRDPRAFDETALRDPDIRGLAARITVTPADPPQERSSIASTVTVTLRDGRMLSRHVTAFKGMPNRPLDQAELRDKFLMLTHQLGRDRMAAMFARLQHLETEPTLDWLGV
jgi:2-methylcitrate dehydratase PrpD